MKTSSEIFDEVQDVFRNVLDEPDLVLTRQSNAENTENWDSMAHVTIIAAIQRHFGVKFALGELQGLKEVGDLVDLIGQKLAAA
jgi:acyl carrier protein